MMKRELRLNGIEVGTSYLTQRSYQAANCDLLLRVTPENRKEALAEFRSTGAFGAYSGLSVAEIGDLSFLSEFPDLRYLEVSGEAPVNTRHLDGLENLRGLYLETPGAGIDFGCFQHLEVYMGGWHAEHRNLAESPELRRLHLRSFNPASRELAPLVGMIRLDILDVTQTNLASLDGLETLEDLRYLTLAYATRLESLDRLASPGLEIREMYIRNAKRIRSYEPIASLNRLRRLRLTACASMESLAWTTGMQHLDFFSFVDTDVADGDLKHLLKLPRLRYVGTLDKKHYSHKCDALNAALNTDRATS